MIIYPFLYFHFILSLVVVKSIKIIKIGFADIHKLTIETTGCRKEHKPEIAIKLVENSFALSRNSEASSLATGGMRASWFLAPKGPRRKVFAWPEVSAQSHVITQHKVIGTKSLSGQK